MEKFDLRSASREEKEAIRKRAIAMHLKGKKNYEIVEALGVNKNSVTNWLASYREEGLEGLREKKRGNKPGQGRLLSASQERQVQRWITDKMPEQLKLPFGLWTRKAVQELIQLKFGIDIAIRTVGDYLHRWGFTPQRPSRRAYEQNPKAVQRWLEEEYPAIAEAARAENAQIHWGDETGVKNESHHGRSFAPRGKTPVRRKRPTNYILFTK